MLNTHAGLVDQQTLMKKTPFISLNIYKILQVKKQNIATINKQYIIVLL